jgi:hypothetical protein
MATKTAQKRAKEPSVQLIGPQMDPKKMRCSSVSYGHGGNNHVRP